MANKWLTLVFLIPAMLMAGAAPVFSVEVYLNGVQVTGAREQVIEKAKVVLDKNGDVRITAPDYKVREVGIPAGTEPMPPAAPATTANLTKKYFVVTEVARKDVTGYTIQVMVNNKFVKALPEVGQYVLELNNYLNEGTNTVSFRALRQEGDSAQSTRAADAFSVILGEGKVAAGGTLTIENVLAEFKVTAIDRGEKAETFTIHTK